MIAEYIIQFLPENILLFSTLLVVSIAVIIFASRTIPYYIMKTISAGINIKQFAIEKTLGAISTFPEAIIIFTLVQIWLHLTSLYTIISLNIAIIFVGLVTLMFLGKQKFIKHIYKPKLFLIFIALVAPFILLIDYNHVSYQTAFVLIIGYISYMFFSRLAMNEPAHPVEYSVIIKPLKTTARKTLIPLTLLLIAAIILGYVAVEMFILSSKVLIIFYEIPKLIIGLIIGVMLAVPKVKSFHRIITSKKDSPELYTHEVFYNMASGTMANSLLFYTVAFTATLVL
jgi:Ca2+/Na+ antiporter